MKMYDNQTFQVGGSQWKYERGNNPQGTMCGKAKDGNQLANIIPYDWSKPIDAPNNALLYTRSLSGNQWSSTKAPMDLKSAIKKGSNHIANYHQDKQIAQIEGFFKNKEKQANQNAAAPQKPSSLTYEPDKTSKPLKGSAAIKAMKAATERFQDGAKHQEQRDKPNGHDQGMG